MQSPGAATGYSELELWFSGLGKVKPEFASRVDIRSLGHLIADKVL